MHGPINVKKKGLNDPTPDWAVDVCGRVGPSSYVNLGNVFNDELKNFNRLCISKSWVLQPVELAGFVLRCLCMPEMEWSEDSTNLST